MLDFNANRVYFFYFVIWISWIFLTFMLVFTSILARKSWNQSGIHEVRKKKIETTCWPGWALGPPLRPSGPAGSASGFNLFLFRTSWNHFGFKISCQNTRETTKKVKKNSWNQITKKKKTRFLFKTFFEKSISPYGI